MLTKGEHMKRGLTFFILLNLILLIGLAACNQIELSLPELDHDKILVTHLKKPRLSVIDRTKQQVIHEEQLEFTVHFLAQISSREIALASQEKDAVYILDVSRNTLHPINITVSEVTHLFYDHTQHRLLVTEARDQEVIVYDLARETELNRIKVGLYPTALALDQSHMYVLCGDSATVTVVDLASDEIVNNFPVVEHPTAIVAEDGMLWVGGHGAPGELNRHVHVYEAASGRQVSQIETGSMPIALYTDAFSDEMFVLSHGSNELHIIDIPSMSVKGVIQTGGNPFYVAGDEQHVYVTALDGNNLIVVDREHHHVRESYSLDAGPYGIVLGGHDHESSVPHSGRGR